MMKRQNINEKTSFPERGLFAYNKSGILASAEDGLFQ